MGHRIGDPAHHVFAVGHLRVHHGVGVQHLARVQVTKVGGDRGGAHVYGKPKAALDLTRGHFYDFGEAVTVPDGNRDLPVGLADDVGQRAQHVIVDPGPLFETVLFLKPLDQALVVAQRVVERGGDQLDVIGIDRRVDLDLTVGGGLANHLPTGAALLGDEDDQIALDFGRTAQPVALFAALFIDELLFDRPPLGDVTRRGFDAITLEKAFLDAYLTLAAGPLLSADGFDLNAKISAGLQDRGALLHFAPASRRLENHGVHLLFAQKLSPFLAFTRSFLKQGRTLEPPDKSAASKR